MSFQGDVAGAGLAEQLQSLARSEREGVLQLESRGVHVRLGLRDNLLYLLPAPFEDQEVWAERCRRAWIEELPLAVRERRMAEIARAARLEILYRMLEAAQLHFRFTPGPMIAGRVLAAGESAVAIEPKTSLPLEEQIGPGFTPEFVLLEHARLKDETQSEGKLRLSPYDVPRTLDVAGTTEGKRAFLEHCDGMSTLAEIGDRLGTALRQVQALVLDCLARNELRLAKSREMLAAAQREIELGRTGRAADRLTGWMQSSEPGPISGGDAQLLLAEWELGRLPQALRLMPPTEARALLRRLDRTVMDPLGSLTRWESLREARRGDPICSLRCMAWRGLASEDVTEATIAELVRIATALREKGNRLRAAAPLRLAARFAPKGLNTRLELGSQMLEAGLVEEGTPWLIDCARELVADQQSERALSCLRNVLRHSPEHSVAQGMLLAVNSDSLRRRRRRTQRLIAASVVLVLAAGAVVRFELRSQYEERLALVTENMNDPKLALQMLAEEFAEDDSPQIQALRDGLQRQWVEEQQRLRFDWLHVFDEAKRDCELGDPLQAWGAVTAMPPVPEIEIEVPQWPQRNDLLNILSARLKLSCADLARFMRFTPDQDQEEARLLFVLDELAKQSSQHVDAEHVDLSTFSFHMRDLQKGIHAHREQRALELAKAQARDLLLQQDQLLATARAHAQARDLERALTNYEALLALPNTDELPQLLDSEIQIVKKHRDALSRAHELAVAGDHDAALEAFKSGCPNPGEHPLPWRLETDPPGASVRVDGGSAQTAPLTLRSAFGEGLRVELTLPGYEPRTLDIEKPDDRSIAMYREPGCSWSSASRVEAAPVPFGEDHIVADRRGRIARLAADGTTRWEIELASLGGISRTPVFLPGKPGHLLILTEDGDAFSVDVAQGKFQGPCALNKPPTEGPLLVRSYAAARLADGRVAVWRDALLPKLYNSDQLYLEDGQSLSFPATAAERSLDSGLATNLAVLRRGAGSGDSLDSPWTDWSVRVTPESFLVEREGSDEHFHARLTGQWTFVSWEAPNARIPNGRLWLSDESGLRTFEP